MATWAAASAPSEAMSSTETRMAFPCSRLDPFTQFFLFMSFTFSPLTPARSASVSRLDVHGLRHPERAAVLHRAVARDRDGDARSVQREPGVEEVDLARDEMGRAIGVRPPELALVGDPGTVVIEAVPDLPARELE